MAGLVHLWEGWQNGQTWSWLRGLHVPSGNSLAMCHKDRDRQRRGSLAPIREGRGETSEGSLAPGHPRPALCQPPSPGVSCSGSVPQPDPTRALRFVPHPASSVSASAQNLHLSLLPTHEHQNGPDNTSLDIYLALPPAEHGDGAVCGTPRGPPPWGGVLASPSPAAWPP